MSISIHPFKVELFWKNLNPNDMQAQYESIRRVASICYGKEDCEKPAEEFVEMLKRREHLSPLEFTNLQMGQEYGWIKYNLRNEIELTILAIIANDLVGRSHDQDKYCFYIECNRSTSHQLVRHRRFSWMQESQRLVNYSDDLPICVWQGEPDNEPRQAWRQLYIDANMHIYEMLQNKYTDLLTAGFRKERARGILPNDTRTRLYMCGFTEDFEDFIWKRDTFEAQADIRWIAQEIQRLMEATNAGN